MKLYIMDSRYHGSIVAIANSMEEARLLMKDCPNYHWSDYVEEKEIPTEPCVIHYNVGDM